MSFSYNPYRHIEVVESEDKDMWRGYCHGCGKLLHLRSLETPLSQFVQDVQEHVHISHVRTPEDFEDWSKF